MQGPWHRGGPWPDHGRPQAGHGSGRRGGQPVRDPHHRAGLRPAGGVDRRRATRRGRSARLYGGRRRIGDRHPPDRDHSHARRAAAHPPGRPPAPGPAQGVQRGGGQRGRSRDPVAGRDPARPANLVVGGSVDQGSGRDRRSCRRQGANHPRYRAAGRVRAASPGPRHHRPPPRCRSHTARDNPRSFDRARSGDIDNPDDRRRVPGAGAGPCPGPARRGQEPVRARRRPRGRPPGPAVLGPRAPPPAALVESAVPHLAVCSYNEIAAGISVETIGVISA